MNNRPLIFTGSVANAQLDCDCACPQTPFQIIPESKRNSYFVINDETYQAELNNEFYLIFSAHTPASPSIINKSAWQQYQQLKSPRLLENNIDEQLAQQQLIIPIDTKPTFNSENPTQLTAWIHITNACNLDCPYCYVNKSSEQMSEEVGKKSIDHLFNIAIKQKFNTIKIKYAGGKALLNFKLIKILHDYTHQLALKNNIEIDEIILSNGTVITDEVALWLKNTGVRLMLSIDSIGEIHDQQRPTKKGQGSFEKIENNLLNKLIPYDIKPDICITVTQQNAGGIKEIVEWVLQHDLPFSINFYRENKLSSSHADLALEEKAIIEGIESAYRIIENNLPDRPLLNGLLDKVQTQAHTHTCGVGQNYLVINHHGKISQCQMHLDKTSTIQSTSSIGNYIPITPAKDKIHNISVEEKEGCKTCVYRYRCTGGCPLETHRATGRWDVKSPHCNIYQTLYPQALRLEGLRLLKINGFSY